MKRYNFIFLFLLFFAIAAGIVACKGKENSSTPPSENNVDAARNFIRAALDGKFKQAATYMLDDSVNVNYLYDVAERSYQKADQSIKDGYRAASINIVKVVEAVKDSVTVLIYSNSFYQDNHDTLKVVKVNGQWLVDFKYLYEHDADTIYLKDVMNNKIK
jgi:hypothetical protein